MNFIQDLTYYLTTTKNPTMKEVFDHAIQSARQQDPEFVESYKWPVKTIESIQRPSTTNSNSTRLEQYILPFPPTTEDFDKVWEDAYHSSMQEALLFVLQDIMSSEECDHDYLRPSYPDHDKYGGDV